MSDVLAGVEAQAAAPRAEEWQQNATPELGGESVLVLDVGHGELVAVGAGYFDREARVASFLGVVVDSGHGVHVDVFVGLHDGPEVVVVGDYGALAGRDLGVAVAIVVSLLHLVIL